VKVLGITELIYAALANDKEARDKGEVCGGAERLVNIPANHNADRVSEAATPGFPLV